MAIIKDIIYSYIVGDSYGLSLLNNSYEELKLCDNKTLNIEKGSYSSMTTFLLCTMDSIIKNKKINNIDIINKYSNNENDIKLYVCDITNQDSSKQLIIDLFKKYGFIDGIVNNVSKCCASIKNLTSLASF